MRQNKYYYVQGFRFHRSVSVVDFIQTLKEVRIEGGPRIKIYFKPGTRTQDFKDLELPPSVCIDSDKLLYPKRNLKLDAKKFRFNNNVIYSYDLDDRVINYVVARNEDTALIEDEKSTTWVVNQTTADNCDELEKIISKSKYVFWEKIPVGEYYSYRYSNTASADSTVGDGTRGSDLPTYIAKYNNPIDFDTYTKWRLEYAEVLLGFYETISSQLEGYSIYMDGKPIRCLDNLSSRRIDITLEGFGNLNRHPYVLEHDLYQTEAEMSLRINTPDQLEYMHLKKKYQNYEFLTDIVRFEVNDKLGLPWTNHIWWEPFRDAASLRSARDESGKLTYTMELRCKIHFYEVEDEMFNTIEQIRVCFANLPEKPEYVFKLKDF